MSTCDSVLADLMTAQANGQSVDGGLAALEEMRRDAERDSEFVARYRRYHDGQAQCDSALTKCHCSICYDVRRKGGDAVTVWPGLSNVINTTLATPCPCE